MDDNKNLMSVKETAEFLGVSPSTVRKWANLSEIETVYDKDTGNRMFKYQEVLNFKDKLQDESYDVSFVGFGVDKLNKFLNSFYGKLFKYSFIILVILIIALGFYTIINLQKEVYLLKQYSNVDKYKVSIVDNLDNHDNYILLKPEMTGQTGTFDTTGNKSYGKILLNVDDTLLGIIGKSPFSLIDESKINLNDQHLSEIANKLIEADFEVENSIKIVRKVTLKDDITGNIYCVFVSNGKLVTVEGQCLE